MLSVFAMIALISACKESSVNPYDGPDGITVRTQILTSGFWFLSDNNNLPMFKQGIMKFASNGTATYRNFLNQQTDSCKWGFNKDANSIFITLNNTRYDFQIERITGRNVLFTLIDPTNNGFGNLNFLNVDQDYEFVIAGGINNTANIVLGNNLCMKVAWFSGSESSLSYYLKGSGQLFPDENLFYIGFNGVLPDETFLINNNDGGSENKFALGYVMLFAKDIPDGRYWNFLNKSQLVANQYIGSLNSSAIVYRKGHGELKYADNDLSWGQNFNQGWNYGTAEYINTTTWEGIWANGNPYMLLFDIQHLNEMAFPIWLNKY